MRDNKHQKLINKMSKHEIKHEDIWRGIDRLANQFGYSASGLAKKAGMDATCFNKSKRTDRYGKPRWPSTESLAKVLNVTGVGIAEFAKLMEDDQHSPVPERSPHP